VSVKKKPERYQRSFMKKGKLGKRMKRILQNQQKSLPEASNVRLSTNTNAVRAYGINRSARSGVSYRKG
jgi:hypothetical protein